MTRRGQATTEYLVIIAFLVVALVAAVWAFVGPFEEGMDHLADDADGLFAEGTRDGSGDMR